MQLIETAGCPWTTSRDSINDHGRSDAFAAFFICWTPTSWCMPARGSSVLDQLRKAGKQRLAIPALVAAELAYGVEKSAGQAHNRELLKELLR